MEQYFKIVDEKPLLLSDVNIDAKFWKDMEVRIGIARSRVKPFVWKKYLLPN